MMYDDYNDSQDTMQDINTEEEPILPFPEEDLSDDEINSLSSDKINFKDQAFFNPYATGDDDAVVRSLYNQAEHVLKQKCKNHCFFTQEEYQRLYKIYTGNDPLKASMAGEILVLSVFKMILNIALKNYSTYFKQHKMDLIQQGNVGVAEALKTYNGTTKFSTWCYPNIVHYMNEYVSTITHHTTTHYATNIQKVQEAINNKRKKNKNFQLADLAIEEGIPISTLLRCQNIMTQNQNMVSFDNQDTGLAETVPDKILGPEATVLANEKQEAIHAALSTLSPQEHTVICLFMGYTENEEDSGIHLSEKEIAERTGIPVTYIKRIKEGALCKLSQFMNAKQLFNEEKRDRHRQSISSLFENAFPTATLQRQLTQLKMQMPSGKSVTVSVQNTGKIN